MANQQLVDYIKQQLQVGVGKDVIVQALKGAGWQDAEVNEAMATLVPSVARTPVISPMASVPAMSAGPSQNTTNPSDKIVSFGNGPSASALSAFAAKPAGATPASQPVVQQKVSPLSSKPASFSVDSLFSPKTGAPAFQSMDASKFSAAAPGDGKKGSRGMLTLVIVLVVVIAGLLVAGGVLYKKNSDLAASLSATPGGGNTANDAQMKTLTASANELSAKVAALTAENEDFKNQLSYFYSSTAKAGDEIPLTLKGTLSTSTKGFTLTTSQEIAVNVKNVKDVGLSAALTPLVGTTVSLTGTHVIGTRDLTVTAVNGKGFSSGTSVPSAATTTTTSTVATTTSEKATSSPPAP